MHKYLFIFNDSPHGSQRAYNGLRLAASLSRVSGALRVFLLGDGVICALNRLDPAHADYNPQELLRQIAGNGGEIAVCGTCLEARGIKDDMLISEARRGTLDGLTQWTEEAEKVITF
jgi:uncharacterized protein involved in oxidation of intracellular sulfur